jgi:hypothetical protein
MKFSCEKCLYYTNKKFCFENHKKSKTHIQKERGEFDGSFQCKICSKNYKSSSGLWNHKKICEMEKKRKEDEELRNLIRSVIKDNIEMKKQNNEILKENNEMKNMLIELSKKDSVGKIENHTNSHNKIDFNLFLNEKCKNAINMSSLIETVLVSMKDIENLERHGYVKTITDMVAEKMNDYSVYERPLHYFIGDKPNEEDEDEDIEPNEIIHIKDNDRWSKEDRSEHDVLLTNLNVINDVLQEKTKGNERMNQEVKSGRRYNKTGKIITNLLDIVKIDNNIVKELVSREPTTVP